MRKILGLLIPAFFATSAPAATINTFGDNNALLEPTPVNQERLATEVEVLQYCAQESVDGNPGVFLLTPFQPNSFEILICDGPSGAIVSPNDCKGLEILSDIFQNTYGKGLVRSGEITESERQREVDAIHDSFRPALESCQKQPALTS